jgi:hypothetical protein
MPHNIGDTVVKGHDDVKSKIQKWFFRQMFNPNLVPTITPNYTGK